MQAAYDDEDDDAFCDICDTYGKAEVHKTLRKHLPLDRRA